MKLDSSIYQFFFVITYKSVVICFNIQGDKNLKLKSGKLQNISPVPMTRHKNVVDLFLMFPDKMKLISYPCWVKTFLPLKGQRGGL